MPMEYGVLFLLLLLAGMGLIARAALFLRQISAPARGSEVGFRRMSSSQPGNSGGRG